MKSRLFWGLIALMLTGCICGGPHRVTESEERLVANCAYIDTVTAFSDLGPFQINPILADEGRDKVLHRAEALNATHIVWLGDYYFGAAAIAYYCWE